MAAIRGLCGARVVFTAAVVVRGTVGAGCRHRVVTEPYRDRTIWFLPSSGCAVSPDSTPRWLPPIRPSDTLSHAFADRTPPQRNAWLARRVPGGYAGGPYPSLGWNQAWVILMRDTTQRAAAWAAVDSLRPASDAITLQPRPDSVVARRVRWDSAELHDWLQHLESNLRGARGSGLNGWGIDEQDNRIELYVESVSTVPVLLTWLEGLSLPCHLVAFQVAGLVGIASVPRPVRHD